MEDGYFTKSYKDFISVFEGGDSGLNLLNFIGLSFFLLNCFIFIQSATQANFNSKLFLPIMVALMFTVGASVMGRFIIEILEGSSKSTDNDNFRSTSKKPKSESTKDIFIQHAVGNFTFYSLGFIIAQF